MERFAGQVAVVTGAATGIGRQAALCFAEAGAQVALLDTAVAAAEDTAHEIERLGAKAIVLRTDVSRDADVRHAIDTTVDTFGRLDLAFNNAGIAPRGAPAAEFDEDEWDRTIAVNLKGVWLCIRHECRHMLHRAAARSSTRRRSWGSSAAPDSPRIRRRKAVSSASRKRWRSTMRAAAFA